METITIPKETFEKMRFSLNWIATVNAMDYEYQSEARAALAYAAKAEQESTLQRVAVLEQEIKDGWALVPVEPTQEMIDSGQEYIDNYYSYFNDLERAYKVMLKAAPKAKP